MPLKVTANKNSLNDDNKMINWWPTMYVLMNNLHDYPE